MGEAGVLAPEERTELIEGVIIDMTPIGSQHAAAVSRINAALTRSLAGRGVVWVQSPVILGELSEPQPDLALLRPREDYYAERHPAPADILLVVEVADTTAAFDRHTKLPLYARHAIPEAWLIDLPAGVLEIHRTPEEGGYTRVEPLGPDDLSNVPVPGLPGVTVNLTGLL
jgi:Uma2 family endonuclease